MGNRGWRGCALTVLMGGIVATVGLRSFAHPPAVLENAPIAQQDDAASDIDDALSGVVASPGPVVRTACCIVSEDRCVNPMTLTECRAARGTLMRHCRLCQPRIVADDGFVFDDEQTDDTSAPTLNPTTVVQLVASFMIP